MDDVDDDEAEAEEEEQDCGNKLQLDRNRRLRWRMQTQCRARTRQQHRRRQGSNSCLFVTSATSAIPRQGWKQQQQASCEEGEPQDSLVHCRLRLRMMHASVAGERTQLKRCCCVQGPLSFPTAV